MRFLEVWDKVCQFKEDHENLAVNAIFTGINVADDFWDNFIVVCNNKEGMAALLGVNPEKIASWPMKIQENLEKSKGQKNPEAKDKDKTKIIDTGEL